MADTGTKLFQLPEGDFLQRQKARVSKFIIMAGLQAVEHFCSDNGASLDSATIVEITLAWHFGMTFEWTPLAPGFRRITFIAPNEAQDKVVIVDNYQAEDGEKSRKLNELIANFTHGKWAEIQK